MTSRLQADNKELVPREVKILSMVARAYTNKQIAEELGMKTRTVYQHLYHIYKKICTGTKENRVEAVLYYWHSDL